ncbi:MAG: PorV/PorQ family protein [Balneolaceae bacterium]
MINQLKSQIKVLVLFAAMILPVSTFAQSLIPGFGTARSGTDGFQFTKISVDPRGASMGNSRTADAFDASSLYWNPALASKLESSEIMFGHTEYFAGITMEYAAYVHRIKSFAFGASIQFLNSGEINETTEFNPLGTGRTFRTTHLSAGITASQAITDFFSYGVTIRYLLEKIEDVDIETAAFDFGFFYRIPETPFRFSVNINNFGFDATPSGSTTRQTLDGVVTETDFEEVTTPTRFIVASAVDVIKRNDLSLVLTAQLTNPSDNSERFSFGGELGYMDQFFLRTGYESGRDEIKLPSAGAGIKFPITGTTIAADYGFSPFERLGNVHRVGIRIIL